MKNLLLVLIGVALFYLVIKAALYQARKVYLSRLLDKIDKLYANLIKGSREELASVSEHYSKWESGDKVQRVVHASAEDLLERISDAQSDREHKEAVHEKYLRLRARFSADRNKLGESIVAYHDYLSVKMKQRLDAESYVRALNVGAMTFDEFSASAQQIKIVVQECERKLDVLLS